MSSVPTIIKAAPLLRTAVVQGNSAKLMSTISGPPKVRISLVEKTIHGCVIAGGMLAIPAWVLVNIKHYRAKD